MPADSIPPPKAVIQQVDERGRISKLPWPVHTEWAWVQTPSGRAILPVLRTIVQMPKGMEVQVGAGSTATVRKSGSSLEIDLTNLVTSVSLSVKDAAGKTSETGLIIQVGRSEPAVLVQPSCAEFGLSVGKESKGKPRPPLYVGQLLPGTGGRARRVHRLFVRGKVRARNARARGGASGAPAGAVGALRARGPEGSLSAARVRTLSISSGGDFGRVRPDLGAAGRTVRPSRWTFSLGLGPTLIKYQESIAGSPGQLIDLTEVAVTGKVSATYALLPDTLDLSANAFGNLLAISHSPSSVPSTQFFGINWRFGYIIPTHPLKLRVTFYAGYYFWGMLTEEHAYGITTLSGPQIFLTVARVPNPASRAWYAYGKLAPSLTDQGAFSLGNREIAFGGGYQLCHLTAGEDAVYLTLDFSNASYNLNAGRNLIVYSTYTLGLQRPF